MVDCVEGAKVTLSKNGAAVAEATTNVYGDFKFDRLEENSGDYTVTIAADGCGKDGRCDVGGERVSRRDTSLVRRGNATFFLCQKSY